MLLKFKRLNDKATMPRYAHQGDSGMDVTACEDATILPHTHRKIETGIAAEIPDGYELQVRPRSGMFCKSGIVAAFGTVDCGYIGPIGVALYNHSNQPYDVHCGDRIAQLVLSPVVRAEIVETDTLADTERGADGFGSTGIRS